MVALYIISNWTNQLIIISQVQEYSILLILDGDIEGYVDVTLSMCLSDSLVWVKSVPDNTCDSPDHVVKIDLLSRRMNAEVSAVSGNTCTCDGHGCNNPHTCKLT